MKLKKVIVLMLAVALTCVCACSKTSDKEKGDGKENNKIEDSVNAGVGSDVEENSDSKEKYVAFTMEEAMELDDTINLGSTYGFYKNMIHECLDENGVFTVPTCVKYDGVFYRVVGLEGLLDERTGSMEREFGVDFSLIKKIVIPETVTKIDSSFRELPNLEEIVFPKNLETIESSFWSCDKMKKIELPKSTTMVDSSFWFFSELEEIKISSGVRVIDDSFMDCTKLNAVTIPETVESLKSRAFDGCTALEKVELNGRKTFFEGYNIFDDTPWLKNLMETDSDGFVVIDGQLIACENRFGLASLFVPDEVEIVGGGAFTNVGSDTGVIVFMKDVELRPYAFMWSNAQGVVFLCEMELVEDYAFYGSHIGQITLGKGVKNVGPYAFYNCDKLWAVNCGFSVEEIGEKAFADCTELENIVLPESLRVIGEYAFDGCEKLDVYVPNACDEIHDSAFRDVKHINYEGSLEWAPFGALSMN